MTPEMWFAAVVLPTLMMIGAWVTLKLHERWLDREIAREQAAAHRGGRPSPHRPRSDQ